MDTQHATVTEADTQVLIAYLAAHDWHYSPIPVGMGYHSLQEWIRAYILLYGGPLVADWRYPALMATATAWYSRNSTPNPEQSPARAAARDAE